MILLHWQTSLFALTGLGMVLMHVLIGPDLSVQVFMLAPLVAILGLPHGALDLPIAEALFPLSNWGGKLVFVSAYLGLSGAVITVWLLAPGAALAMFLGYSAVHFSEDWAQASPALRWTGGAATIGAPALFHPEDVEAIFAMLAPQSMAAVIADATALIGVLAGLGFVVSCLLVRNARKAAAFEQAVLWMTAAILPPLMYFVVYFCALHSVRHFTGTLHKISQGRRALAVSVTLSAIVILTALFVLLYGTQFQRIDMTEQIIRIVFIGLAALTVPHMILVDRFTRKAKLGSTGPDA